MSRIDHLISPVFFLVFLLAIEACATANKSGDGVQPTAPGRVAEKNSSANATVAAPAMDVAAIVSQQNHRVAGLKIFATRGSAELRWHDENGDHFEQAQVDLAWRNGGDDISLRADKMGERLAWAGANAKEWWLFEPKREPSRLWLGARDRPVPDSLLPFAGPDALLELLAALSWPNTVAIVQESPGNFTAEFARPPRGAWVKTRVQVDKNNALPSHISLLDAKGAVLAESELSVPVMAVMNHLPMADRPMVASKITLKSVSNVGVWQIFWDEPGAREDRLKDRLFDLEVIRGVMRPVEVIDLEKAPKK
ncbi:MAG: hypothetical protein EXS12_07080 [Phycisphaerales bacterium]|nr:hypothetical protein [Phycisphaerales bacterium]